MDRRASTTNRNRTTSTTLNQRRNNSTSNRSNRSNNQRITNTHHRQTNNSHRSRENNLNQRRVFSADVFICILCKKRHAIKSCRKFLAMDVRKRQQFIDNHRYCLNCLARSHDFRACPSMDRCKKCDSFHHTLLHPKRRSLTTAQLRQRKHIKETTAQSSNSPAATSSTVVISEAIKSLAAILCSSGR